MAGMAGRSIVLLSYLSCPVCLSCPPSNASILPPRMDTPLITILIPTYEPNPHFLREALDGLKRQTETRWKAVIHDDASDISVEQIVAPYLRAARFSFVRSRARLGIGGNWNACLKHVDSDYV